MTDNLWVATFGGRYAYEPHPSGMPITDRHFLVVVADDEVEARQTVFDLVGEHWAFMYEWDEFVPQIAEYNLIPVPVNVQSWLISQVDWTR